MTGGGGGGVGEPAGVAGRLSGAGGKKGRSLGSGAEVRRFPLPTHLLARPSADLSLRDPEGDWLRWPPDLQR